MNNSLDNSLLHLLYKTARFAGEHFAELAVPKQIKGLTPRQFFILAAIGGGETQAVLAEKLGSGSSKTGEIIGRLQSKGLVVRSRSKKDPESLDIRLTDTGRETLHASMTVAMRVDERLLDMLPAGKYGDLTSQLRFLAAANEKVPMGR